MRKIKVILNDTSIGVAGVFSAFRKLVLKTPTTAIEASR